MSRIYVNRIEALAAKRIERASQVAALPPQPARLDTNLWGQMRTPWMHARYVGMMSRVVGRDDPIKEALGESKALQTWVTNNYPEYNLEELLVSPELPSEIALALQEQVAYYDPTAPTPELMALYKPAGYHITTEAFTSDWDSLTLALGERRVWAGAPIAAPCILREISWDAMISTAGMRTTYAVDGYGTVAAGMFDFSPIGGASGRSARGIDRWILSATIVPTIEVVPNIAPIGAGDVLQAGRIVAVCEPLIRL